MRRFARDTRNPGANLAFLVGFGVAFGFVEAAVVYYLRRLIYFHQTYPLSRYKVLLNLGFITFVSPAHTVFVDRRVADVEVVREAATLVMLLCVAYLAGRDGRSRLGAFLVAFSCWDLAYYLFLRVVDDWPKSLMTRDVYFLIPVTWIGPVITPILISLALLALGVWLFRN